MERRAFMLSVGGAAAGLVLLPRAGRAAAGRVDWYTNSDQNVLDFWTNVVQPAFEAANPGVTLNLVDAGDDAGTIAIAERALAARGAGTDPQADYLDNFDPRLPAGAIEAGLFVNVREAGLQNWGRINPLAIDTDYAVPYRGSQVLLAFDTTKLAAADVPRTFPDLVAWIEANPGQFIYNRPDKGGSGGNFVRRAVYEANGLDPSRFTVDNFSPEAAEAALVPSWDLLARLAPSLFDEGAYTSGNTQSIQLLGQSAVTMIPAWSDQVIQAIQQGVLPETTGLVQLTDLGLPGGFSRSVILQNGVNRDAALRLADFVLTEEIQNAVLTELGGFPGVSWEHVSGDLRERYADVIPATIPVFPGGAWEAAINDGWYRNVAPNVPREE